MNAKRSAVFIDRDGVINKLVPRDGHYYSPRTLEDFVLFDYASDAIAKLRTAGLLVFVVTNQPDVARGHLSLSTLRAMHDFLDLTCPIDAIYVCTHDNIDCCECRKPKPGLLMKAAEQWDLDLSHSWMIGDRESDIAAGHKAGCRTILISGNQLDQNQQRGLEPIVSETLKSAVSIITTELLS